MEDSSRSIENSLREKIGFILKGMYKLKKRAILSVSDKTGIVRFAKGLLDAGYEIISTGGTAKALEKEGIPVIPIEEVTNFPECLDGRVKTLNPKVFAGILAMRANESHMQQLKDLDCQPIDIVCVNLYPFKETIKKPNVTLEEAIENIDIGGPSMLRAAAKNWQDVAVITDAADYDRVLSEIDDIKRETKFYLALKVFRHTAAYDAMISDYLADKIGDNELPENLTLTYEKLYDLRYGENSHQKAAFYKEIIPASNSLALAKQLHGKELSYNNINDANGALDILKEFGEEKPCAVAVKHANPCGVAVADTISEAYKKCYESDPVSIFGGIIALNRPCDKSTAEQLSQIFLEIIIAPSFTDEALEILTKKKNIRLMELADCAKPNHKNTRDFKKVVGGLLVQNLDTELLPSEELKVVTKRQPTEKEMKELMMAWKIVKQTKSNAIVLVKDDASVGIGPGQTNRVTALSLAIKYAGEKAEGSVMGSDAFFPFDDCVKLAFEHKITAIIQPGGSIKDEDSIKACDEAGIAMVFTGMRHFKH